MPSSLEDCRRAFLPTIPKALRDILRLGFSPERAPIVDEEILSLLPRLGKHQVCSCTHEASSGRREPLRIGLFFSGGPAPGGHNVVTGLFDALQKWNRKSTLVGFLDGPLGLLKNASKELVREEIDAIRNTGGFSLLGTGREKIESEEEISKAADVVCRQRLDGLVCIGGDDSNTDAAFIAEAFLKKKIQTCVVGVPKTIDGDLTSPDIALSFGFDTACKVYSCTIGDIARDCLSTKRQYFFIRLMGRCASHITLECALRTQPNLALIGEEVSSRTMSLRDVVSQITDLVEERHRCGREFGVILVPEGLIEQMADLRALIAELNGLFASSSEPCRCTRNTADALKEPSRRFLLSLPPTIQEQLVIERDPHGNVHVSQIDTARLLALAAQKELSTRGIPFTFQTAFCGYEGRSAFPSDFDCTYCYALGRLSALMIAKKMTGYMAAIRDLHQEPSKWTPAAVPLASLLHFERRGGRRLPVIQKRLVDLSGPAFRRFAEGRELWRLGDQYLQPGPIQFG